MEGKSGVRVADGPARVIFVCHANVCRSPLAERLLRRAIDDPATMLATSGGTHVGAAAPMHPYSAQVLREHGADDRDFASRAITAGSLATADLILTATREQRGHCVSLAPATLHRTFTLLQFGRLAAAINPDELPVVAPPIRLRAAIAEIARVRAELPVAPGIDDDLADPLFGPIAAFRACASQIHESLRHLPALACAARPAAVAGPASARRVSTPYSPKGSRTGT